MCYANYYCILLISAQICNFFNTIQAGEGIPATEAEAIAFSAMKAALKTSNATAANFIVRTSSKAAIEFKEGKDLVEVKIPL